MSPKGEWATIDAALVNLLRSGVIFLNDQVEAFRCGEWLSATTMVIHLEKANPGVRGLYAAINQEFCR